MTMTVTPKRLDFDAQVDCIKEIYRQNPRLRVLHKSHTVADIFRQRHGVKMNGTAHKFARLEMDIFRQFGMRARQWFFVAHLLANPNLTPTQLTTMGRSLDGKMVNFSVVKRYAKLVQERHLMSHAEAKEFITWTPEQQQQAFIKKV